MFFFCKDAEIITNCWTIINRRMLEHTKNDNPHSRTKEKSWWDGRRGAITLKLYPILPGAWPTNWRKIIPKKFSHCCDVSRPHIRLPNLGTYIGKTGSLGIWLWKPVRLISQRVGGMRKTETLLLKDSCTKPPAQCPSVEAAAWNVLGSYERETHWLISGRDLVELFLRMEALAGMIFSILCF